MGYHRRRSLNQAVPDWCLKRPKPMWQATLDLLSAPLRMVLLPDQICERIHVTSLRAERFAAVLPHLRGRLLDVGAGDNALVRLYQTRNRDPEAARSVGVDIVDWGADCLLVERSDALPFPDASFDTVSFIASLNHIPERAAALVEARRLLRPGGRVVITMIGPLIGRVGHALWWYSEEKHRHVDEKEELGMSNAEIVGLLRGAGFTNLRREDFLYGLNHLFVAYKPMGG